MYCSNAALTIYNYSVIRELTQEVPVFKSMSQLRARNKKIGHIFFSRATMKQWNSKIETTLYKGRFFIMSEQGREQNAKRKFKIWEALQSGEVVSLGQGIAYPDLDTAKEALRAILKMYK